MQAHALNKSIGNLAVGYWRGLQDRTGDEDWRDGTYFSIHTETLFGGGSAYCEEVLHCTLIAA